MIKYLKIALDLSGGVEVGVVAEFSLGLFVLCEFDMSTRPTVVTYLKFRIIDLSS